MANKKTRGCGAEERMQEPQAERWEGTGEERNHATSGGNWDRRGGEG